jgi:uncharacterized SAM-binding protein YcdF (DUF218 family)
VIRLAMIVTLAALVAVLMTARLFVFPPTDRVGEVDAVVVLSGDYGDRIAGALALMRRGAAPVLVHAGAPDGRIVKDLCAGPADFEVVCLHPEPDNTRAEARAVGALARDRGWHSIALVTSKPHLTRAGMLFRRCVDGDVRVVATNPPYSRRVWLRGITQEWAKTLAYGVARRGC